jgi:RHS repeat-associated protein
MFYDIDFRIVFKVGNPTSGPRTPLEHIQYNYSTNWLDQLESTEIITYDVSGNIDTVTTSQSFTYDNQGNPIRINGFKYEENIYDHAVLEYQGRQLTAIYIYSDSAGNVLVDSVIYTYNDQGYRTSKTVGGVTTTYYLQNDLVIYETDGTYGIIYTYDYDGRLISFNYDNDINDSTLGIEYYYLHNQQGDITKIVDKDGNIVVEYYYDIWGNITKATDITGIDLANKNPYRYRGYRYDNDIDMYYLNSRYYDSNIGRFINADGLLGEMGDIASANMFAYCANNPVMYSDISGYAPEWLKTMGIVGAIVGTVLVVAAITILTCGVGTATLAGAIAVGAAKGALIGAAIGVGVGATAGAVGSIIAGEEFGSSEFWSNTGYGAMAGFGIGALIGAISGGIYAGVTYSPPTFSSTGSLEKHFLKHGNEFNGLYSNSLEYQKGAQYVINNGKYIKQMNGYIRFFGSGGKANYAFVGMNNAGKIVTYGVRGISSLSKVIPWIVI